MRRSSIGRFGGPRPATGGSPSRPPHWDGNALISEDGHGRMVMMMMVGFKRRADVMVAKATTDCADRDPLVFPILFNYRQYLELSLNYLIAAYGDIADVRPVWDTHDLTTLWCRSDEILEHYDARGEDSATAAVSAIIAEFATVDPRSFSFRYPVDTKGRPLILAHEHLDLAALADVIQGVDGYFGGCDGLFDAMKSAGA